MPTTDAKFLLTRPQEGSMRLAKALIGGGIAEENIKIAPLMRFEFLPMTTAQEFDVAIFTSATGVQAFGKSSQGNDRTAFCVGDRTAAAAKGIGFVPISAKGGARNLIALLRIAQPVGAIVHFRGSQVHQNIADPLAVDGFKIFEQIVYQQVLQNFDESTARFVGSNSNIKIPLFSQRTAMQFEKQEVAGKNCDIFCMSEDVKSVLTTGNYRNIKVISKPTQISMVQAMLAGN